MGVDDRLDCSGGGRDGERFRRYDIWELVFGWLLGIRAREEFRVVFRL